MRTMLILGVIWLSLGLGIAIGIAISNKNNNNIITSTKNVYENNNNTDIIDLTSSEYYETLKTVVTDKNCSIPSNNNPPSVSESKKKVKSPTVKNTTSVSKSSKLLKPGVDYNIAGLYVKEVDIFGFYVVPLKEIKARVTVNIKYNNGQTREINLLLNAVSADPINLWVNNIDINNIESVDIILFQR